MSDHRPDLHGRVEATWRTAEPPAEVAAAALAAECPDCNVNVFVHEDATHDGVFHTVIAHDETCSWLALKEAAEGA